MMFFRGFGIVFHITWT